MIIAYPFSIMLYQMTNKEAKHLFSFVVGFVLMQWVFGPDWVHAFIAALGTYLICALCPSKWQGKVTFFFVMGYMILCHIHRMYVSYLSGVFDYTGTQMVLTMKLTSFAYNMYDGTADKHNVFPEVPHSDPKKAKVYADRAKFAITKLPNPLEFFGYVYCFTCIMAGPAFEYKDYERAIDCSVYVKNKHSADLTKTTTTGTSSTGTGTGTPTGDKSSSLANVHPDGYSNRPRTLVAGAQRLLVGILSLAIYMTVFPYVPVERLYDPEFIASTPYLQRYLYLLVCMVIYRFKFFFAWKVAEGASILAGFGFEGYTAEGKEIGWKGVENIDILSFERATNLQTTTRHWNKRTQGWLERYTYHRTGRSLVATYFISAFWHGLYPGYYLMFMTLPLVTVLERQIKAKINPLLVPEYDGYNTATYPTGVVPTVYWYTCWVVFMIFTNYVAQVFSMGSLENSLVALGGHYYGPHIVLVVASLLLSFVPDAPRSKVKKQE
jgi:hypothetical protein